MRMLDWSFEVAGADKTVLTTLVRAEIAKAKPSESPYQDEAVLDKVGGAILLALDRQAPSDGFAFLVKSQGYLRAGSALVFFEIRRTRVA